MKNIIRIFLGKLNIAVTLCLAVLLAGGLGGTTYVLASATSNFTQTINAGTLAADIVDGSYVTVASPSFAMTAATFSFSCQTKTGTFGEATQQIYVSNPDAADSGWNLALAGSSTSAVWDSAGVDFDFNDPTSSGCTDGADVGDTVGGQMTVDPSVGTLSKGACASCDTTGVTLGASPSSFSEGVTDSINIISATSGSNDIGDWKATGISISQKIPAEQPAASDYDINLVLTATAL